MAQPLNDAAPIITVVGSFAVGLTMRASALPIFGETSFGTDFDMGPGGKGSNQAVGIARLGGDCALVGLIGEDALAKIATDLYAAEGVSTTHLGQTAMRATGVGFIILNTKGENFILLDMGANELMTAARVDEAEARIAKSGTVMAVLEIPLEAAMRAMILGRKHGARTILNPAPARVLPHTILPYIDYLTPNESELRILMGLAADDPASTADLARGLRAQGVGNVVVTLGANGALILTDKMEEWVPPCKVPVVDTTGAGDAFNAGFAIALGEGRDLVGAVKFANACGAIACTKLGVVPSLARRADAEELHDRTY